MKVSREQVAENRRRILESAGRLFRARGFEAVSVAEVMKAFNNAEAVKKVRILADEWLPDSEELTPTSKLKRRGIHGKYADEIAALYS